MYIFVDDMKYFWKITDLFAPGVAPAIAFVALTCLCLMPSASVNVEGPLPYFDKVCHFVAFGALALLAVRDLWRKGVALRVATVVGVVVVVALYGGVIELLQGLPSIGRSCDLSDFVADVAGATVGAVVSVMGSKK